MPQPGPAGSICLTRHVAVLIVHEEGLTSSSVDDSKFPLVRVVNRRQAHLSCFIHGREQTIRVVETRSYIAQWADLLGDESSFIPAVYSCVTKTIGHGSRPPPVVVSKLPATEAPVPPGVDASSPGVILGEYCAAELVHEPDQEVVRVFEAARAPGCVVDRDQVIGLVILVASKHSIAAGQGLRDETELAELVACGARYLHSTAPGVTDQADIPAVVIQEGQRIAVGILDA